MAIFEPIDILSIARECGVGEYKNIVDLKDEFESVIKTPKYVIGFLKYKKQIEGIKRSISMLENNEQVGYKLMYNSINSQNAISVMLDSNEELNMFIQLSKIAESDMYNITEETRKSVIREIMKLSDEDDLIIGYFFLFYLHYLEYIELDNCDYEKVYLKLKEIADTEYYLNRNYRKIALRFSGIFGKDNDFCLYALKLPLLISICEYKKGNTRSSFEYLRRMPHIVRQYEIEYEERLVSEIEEKYIYYEIARRFVYGGSMEQDFDTVYHLVNTIDKDCNDMPENEVFQGYIFEMPSKKQINKKEFKSMVVYLSDSMMYGVKDTETEYLNVTKEYSTATTNQEKESGEKVIVSNRDWDKVENLVKELNEMQGLNSVKRKVNEIIAGIKVAEYKMENFADNSDNLGTMHLIFSGNAGTGKTTVARILGKIYGALGIIKNEDLFVECGRADLVGEYLGHTAPKVKKMVESALGGILFIDEAYSLTDNGDAFGMEAINTLIAEVENHRMELIVILAGYKDKMQEFLESNQGLSSRFSTEIYFEDYSSKDMVEIIKKMGMERAVPMHFQAEAEAYLLEFFKKKIGNEPNFGNARGVRNVFEAMIREKNSKIAAMISDNIKPEQTDLYTFQLEDVFKCSVCGSLMNMRSGKFETKR